MWRTKSACFALLCVLSCCRGATFQDLLLTDFSKLVKSKTFVDKTLLIKEFFTGDYHIATAPRGFGKSANVDMLKRFLQTTFDDTGEPIVNVVNQNGSFVEKQPTNNYLLFKENNLNIYQNKEFFYQHCGNHTVIYVSFKSVTHKYYDDVVKGFKLAVSKAFEENKHIVPKLGEEDKARFLKYLDYGTLTVPETQCGLTFLSRVINQHYRKKPVVLVDDFDTPVLESIYNAYKDVDKTVQFIREIYSHLLIENRNVERALLSATDPKLADILSKYTNPNAYIPVYPNEFSLHPFLGGSFSQYFGFTDTDVRNLLSKFKLTEYFEKVQSWYGGYTIQGKGIEMFNPVSVLMFLNTGTIGPYYLELEGVKHLKEIFFNPKIQDPIEKLVSGEEIVLNTLNINLNVDYVLALHRIFKKPLGHKLTDDGTDYATVFVHYLTDHGFFNVIETDEDIRIRVPNVEIAREFSLKLHSVTYYVDTRNYDYMNVEEFVDNLKELNINEPKTFQVLRKSADRLYEKDVVLPKNDYELYSTIYTFVKTFGVFKPVVGNSHAIGPRKLDLLMVREDGTAILLQTKFKTGSAVEALKEIFNNGYNKFVHKHYGNVAVKDVVYIGFHLSEDRKVSISYLVNSDNVRNATILS